MSRSKQNRGNRTILSPFLLLLVLGFLFTVEKVMAMEGVDNAPTGEGAVESPKKEGNGSSSAGHSVIMDVPIEGGEEEDVKDVPIEGEEEKVLSRSPSSSSSSSKSSSNGSSKKEMPEPSDVQVEEDVLDTEEPSNITEAENEYDMVEHEQEKRSEEFGGDDVEEHPSSPKQSSPKATSPHSSPSKSPRKMEDLEEQYIEEHQSSPKANYDSEGSDEELPQQSSPKVTSPHSSFKKFQKEIGEVFSLDEDLPQQSSPKTTSPHPSPKSSPEKFDDSESSEDLQVSYGEYLPSDEELMARNNKGKQIEKSPSVSSTKTEKNSDNEFEEPESPQFTPPRLSSSELKKELEKNYGLVVPKWKHLDEGDDGLKSKGMKKAKSLPELSQKSEDFSPLKSEKLSASFSHDIRENKGIVVYF
ncbi:unnamed protein product [Meloidogyne enterolobii]|uniref:Uncharacterized protein n=1 Tax=Meloidogyne enterolobii TaxID=390850 RepID=A0ACB1AC99_MELEN